MVEVTCCKISEKNMAVDLLFRDVQRRRKRICNLKGNLVDGLSEAEVKSRYRFSRESIEFIIDTLAADLERPTGRNRALKPEEQVLVALRFSQVVVFWRF